jgi:hypothetical protein
VKIDSEQNHSWRTLTCSIILYFATVGMTQEGKFQKLK